MQAGAVQDSTKQCRMAQVGWHKQDGAVRAVQDGSGQDRTRGLRTSRRTWRYAPPRGGSTCAPRGQLEAGLQHKGAWLVWKWAGLRSQGAGLQRQVGWEGTESMPARVAACPIDPPGYDGGRGDPCLLDHSVRCAPLQLSLAGMRVPTSRVPTQPLLYIAGSSRPLSLGWVPPCRCTAPVSVRVVTHVWAVAPNPPSCVVPWTPLHTQPHVGWLWGAAACLR